MVQIALVFVALAILVHLLVLAAAVYFIPRVLAEEDHGNGKDGQDVHAGHAG